MNTGRFRSLDLLWLSLVLLVALGIAFLLPVTPQDYWWYLRIGQDTLSAGAVPQVDALSHTQTGQPVVYHSWAAALLFFLVYQAGGLPLTFLLRGLVIAVAYSLVWWTARRLGAGVRTASLVLLVAVLASSNNWSVRPQLLAYPLFGLAVWVLYRWQDGNNKALIWLPLASLLWVNLHGSFVILVLLVGAAFVFGKGNRRLLALTLGGVLLATLANPRAVGAWTYVVDSLTVASSQVFSAEWKPPVNEGWQMNLFFLWLLAFPLLTALSQRRLSRLEWAWFLGFGLLALSGLRYVIWFIMVLTVLTALLLAGWGQRRPSVPLAGIPALNLALGLAFLLLPLALLPGIRSAWWPQAPPVTENTPVAATAWLQEHPELPGPLWSEIGFSSYLEFALPERPTWIDTRFEVFPVGQWETYREITYAYDGWDSLLDESGVNLLMVSHQYQPRLVAALDGSDGWCALYRDDIAVVYRLGPCGGE
ncbi:MAG: hypothetical protein ABIJ39_02360 [Chloroflexota bacterium]